MGWLVVNVLFPALLPVLLLAAVKAAPAARQVKLMETVKDGQLCWFALTLSCSTFYDLLRNDQTANRLPWDGYAMGGMEIIGLFVAVYAVVAALQTTPLLPPPPSGGRNSFWRWADHYAVFMVSAGLSTVAAIATFAIHVQLDGIAGAAN